MGLAVLFRTPFFLPLVYPELTWRIPTTEKKIYLTFDDGPVPGPTEFVLEQLKRYKAKATFFCIGNNIEKHRSVFDRIVKEGHVVGNHTFNHAKGWSSSDERYLDEVKSCQALMGKVNLFRPPYGRIRRSQIKLLKDYHIVMWDVLSHDYSPTMSEERCLKGVSRATRKGSIVVFHDSYKAEKNMTYVLPRILDHFSQQGFTFDSLSEAR